MDNALILFTNYFPFYHGEEYLETELPVTVQYYKKILIIPTMVDSHMTQTRAVPNGVEIFVPEVDCSLLGEIKMFLQYSLHIYSEHDTRRRMKEECKSSVPRRLYYLYYQSRVRTVTKKIQSFDFSEFKKYDLTIYSYWMHVVASIALMIRKTVFKDRQVQLICRGHRYDLYANRNRLNYIPDRQEILKSYTAIFPCSKDGVRYLNHEYPGHENIIHLQRLGTLDHGRCCCSQKCPCLLLSCSSVTKIKRLKIIVDLIIELEQRGRLVKWIHFGDGPEMGKVKKYAARSLKKSTFEFKGHVSNEELMSYYKEYSPLAFLNVSSSEGVPVSIMEAQSFGIPVIATNVGGTRELIENGVNGYLLEKDVKIKDLADKVEILMDMNATLYLSMCEKARQFWQNYSNAVQIYHDFYRELME